MKLRQFASIHGLGRSFPAAINPRQPAIYLVVVSYRSASYPKPALADLIKALRQTNAPLSDFEITASEQDE